jgi:RNA polymerase sigma factor (TIGR02999 family)
VPETTPQNVTQLLLEYSRGNEQALADLMLLVYDELCRLARSYMRRERPGHTLATTGLIHEAYLRLIDQQVEWKSRAHFFRIAAQMMRHVLVDHAKSHHRAKRGGGAIKLSLDEVALVSKTPDMDLVALDEVLNRLEVLDPQRGRIVELRFFAGLSNGKRPKFLSFLPRPCSDNGPAPGRGSTMSLAVRK